MFYSCDPGLVPEGRMSANCTRNGWSPNPGDLSCSVGMLTDVKFGVSRRCFQTVVPSHIFDCRKLHDCSYMHISSVSLCMLFMKKPHTKLCSSEAIFGSALVN